MGSLTLLSTAASVLAARGTVNPLGEVLDLMANLAAKITADGEVEAKAYAKFFAWCDDAARNTKLSIKTAETKKAKLEAAIGKAAGDADASASKIDELASSISEGQGDLDSASKIREKEATDFTAKEAELVDVVDTLGRAIGLLEKEMAKNSAAFAQMGTAPGIDGLVHSLGAIVDAASFSNADKQKLLSMVQSQQNEAVADADLGAPAAATYKTHSTGILDVLEDLKEKAEEQLSKLRKAETSAKHNYAMLKQSLTDQMAADNKDMADEKASRASSKEAKATAEGDLANTVKDLADGEQTLQTTSTSCMTVAADHEATVKSRKEELAAIAEATGILRGSTSGAVSQTYSFLQEESRSQLKTRMDLARIEVETLVKRLAEKHHSAALAQLASRIAAVLRLGTAGGADPFGKVKSLIADLISKLENEAGAEATEKAYCDEQIAKTEAKKAELEEDTAKLTSKIDSAAAKSAGLKADVKELQAELAALAKQQAEMDSMRMEERADYAQAKSDLELGLAGVRKAIGVLRKYYSSTDASMIQAGSDMSSMMQQPVMPEKHVKAGDAGSSIIGILEVCESDFAKNLAEETSEEDDAEAAYQKKTQENKVTKTIKDQDVKYNTQEFQNLDKEIAELSGDRETTNSELSAVLDYYGKIKERCIAKPESYESRKTRREAEIQGLKEALTILQDKTAFVQRRKRSSQSHFLGVSGQ